jgi:hypothetical protein
MREELVGDALRDEEFFISETKTQAGKITHITD